MAKVATDKAAVKDALSTTGAELSADEERAFKRTLWRERMYSLWAPITVFGVIFALYILLIELYTPAYHWAQPVMKFFGLLALASFFALLLARNFYKPFGRLRATRHMIYEILGELRAAMQNKALHQDRLAAGVVKRETLKRLYIEGNVETMTRVGEETAAFIEKDLGRKRFGSDFFVGFVKAFAIAMAIRTVIIEPFKIPSGSMIPTLEIGDQIFVNKFIYGVRIPYMNKVPFQIVRAPQRGDVIVFNNPLQPDKDFIKRIVGVGGDEILIKEDTITINGVVQPRQLMGDAYKYMDQGGPAGLTENNWSPRIAQLYEENLSGHLHPTLQEPANNCGPVFNGGQSFKVPEGTVFVMGDNRDNSSDSRYGLGVPGIMCREQLAFVPLGHIKGKAMVVWLSLGFEGLGHQLFGGTGFRTDRLFKPVR